MLAPLYDEQDELEQSIREEARCRTGDGGLAGVYFSEELQDIARATRWARFL